MTTDISETILREVEISVKAIENDIRLGRREFHSSLSQGSNAETNETDNDQISTKSNIRRQEDATTVQETEGHNDSRRDDKGATNQFVDQVRDDEEETPTGQYERQIPNNADDGDTISALQGSRDTSQGADESTNRGDEEIDSAKPVAHANIGDRGSDNQTDDIGEIDEQIDIDHVLLSGSGFAGGKQRIIDFYFEEHTNAEKIAFLKKEFGTGGGSMDFPSGNSGFQMHDTKGITIHNQGFDNEPIKVTWSKAAKRIGELIDIGRYFEQRYPSDEPLIKPTIAEKIETQGADEAPFLMPENDNQTEKKRRTQPEMNFARLEKLVPHIMDKRYRYAKLQSEGYVDLTIEWIGENRLAIAHYGEQNGDLMADPDMELIVDFENQTVLPATYQNDYLGVYQEVYADDDKWRPKLSKQLTSFLSTWLRNVEFQGHVLTNAKYLSDEMLDTPIIFNDQGQEYGHDIPHDITSMARLEKLQPEKGNPIELDYTVGSTIIEASSSYEFDISAIDDDKIVYTVANTPEREPVETDRKKFDSYIRSGVFDIVKVSEYDFGFGSLGNGITIWNSLAEVNGDYQNLAHIGEDGKITYYVDDLPQDILSRIEEIATRNSPDAQQELPQSRLSKGMIVELDERKYRVESIDVLNDKLKLEDITFKKSAGFPIFRSEYLSRFENELEQAGFFDKLQPEQESPQTEKINYHITDDNLGIGGAKDRFKQNIKAIKLLKKIESEDRLATSDEQEILSQYVGWGGLAKAFDDMDNTWSDEYAQLKNILDESEYTQARASTLNAFYTSPTVIKAMYNALENMGFAGGNILEPAMGIGNFFGMLPASISDSNMYGVELDSISGRIAQQLYQRENIQVTGFEHTAYPDNFFDIAVGNVPFGAYAIADSRYEKHKFNVHDYFFAKSLDKVRPGGIVAFITSKGTLDKKNSNVRKYLAQRAELVGAIRLPNNAFKSNAGTEVTSDIIFLKKRDSILDIEPDWVHLGITDDGLAINQYFIDNPHMVLGTLKEQIGMYGSNDITCVPNDDIPLEAQLAEAINHIQAEIEENIYMVDEPDEDDNSIPADPDVKNYSYCIREDELFYRENSRMNPVETNNKAKERVKAMIGLRSTLNNLISTQMDGHAEHTIRKQQSKLDTQYNEFVSKFGRINSRANNMAMREDSSYYLLCSLEIFDDEGDFSRKADIFTKNTIRPYREITHVDTASEALAVSLARKGEVDIGYISKLTDREPQQVIDDLKGVIYKDPMSDNDNIYDGWQTADEYLSGDVREKLNLARLAAKSNPALSHHVTALEQVQPKDPEASDIDVKIGTIWIPPKYYEEFIYETLSTPNYHKFDINVQYSNYSGMWNVSSKSVDYSNVNANQKYGTGRMNAYWIMEETLNLKNVQIKDRVVELDGSVRYVTNKKETMLARQKQTQLSDEFKNWIFKDEHRRNHLVRLYNDTYNNTRPREYDGSHLDFFGMNPEIELRPHQKNAVARQLYGGNALLAHAVGAGKSFTMIAAAMESKRLGLSNKNLFTVPNHLTEQLAAEALRLYPSANVLVATKKDFKTKNRKKFCSRIATGDYDIVILGHTQFEKIPLSQDRVHRMLSRQIDEITMSVANQRRSAGSNFNVKQMEKTKKSLQVRLEKLNDQRRKDDVIEFEELGIDRLFVDESQYFKNLFLVTKMRNVAGIQQTETQKSTDMLMKCQYLDEITGGRGITFASGTPISNSMTELFTVQRYLQMNELRKRGLEHFDSWASVFGEIETAYELAPEGGKFRSKSRFAKFYNLPELMNMFKNVADVQTNDMINLPMPRLKGDKYINISVLPTDIQRNMIAELGNRADDVRDRLVEPNVDNMLKITNDGRKIALDQRLINPLLPDDKNSKINTAMDNIYDIWKRTKADKSTQLVFCDISTPKKNGAFSIYTDLKKKWIDKGIPEDEIAFIHDAKDEIQKARLFGKVRSGEVRILLGSTQMMGAGTNVQTKLKAVHHLDCPWRPSDLERAPV